MALLKKNANKKGNENIYTLRGKLNLPNKFYNHECQNRYQREIRGDNTDRNEIICYNDSGTS